MPLTPDATDTREPSTTPEETRSEAIRALARAARAIDRASGEMSLAHYRVLAAIAGGEERASRVAARLALGKPTVSAAVDALGQRGLVERSAVSGDARAAALTVTAEGAATLARLEAAMLARVEAFAEASGEPEEIFRALAALGRGIDRVRERERQ